jgi:oligopeptidase B
VKQTPTPNVDLDAYVATRHWAEATDGTKVPVDVVRHVDTPVDGTAACCVYGYGSYEVSMPPWFSVARLSLLDRGAVWALVHPRGGGELGRQWYLDGKLLQKRNTFTDTSQRASTWWPSASRPGTGSRSAAGAPGGCSSAPASRWSPQRFRSAVAEVPFVDVTTTMSDPTLPLTVTEWEEWGDPRSEPYASYIESYSPYDNTAPGEYPALYITAGSERPAGELPRARQVDGEAAGGANERSPAAPQDRDGRGPRRTERPLRRLARRGPGAHLPPADL